MVTKINSPRPSPTKKKVDKLKMFLENDRKVLRFYAQWDDSANLFGEKSTCCNLIAQLRLFL